MATVRKAEEAAGLGDQLTRVAANYAFKVMAYKDEYEVARMYTDGTFAAQLADTFHGGKIRLNLAPPLISKKDEQGHLKKKEFGAWVLHVFKIMRPFKFLRGTAFDPFGWTQERKDERALRDSYLEKLVTLSDGLTAKNHALAVMIAEIPDEIRGYGHVKEAATQTAAAREAALWAKWPEGGVPAEKTTLIAAE